MAIQTDQVELLEATSTPDFVRAVFDLYDQDKLFAIMRQDTAGDARFAQAPRRAFPNAATGGWVETASAPKRSDTPAQIVFSSGTEGLPKAIVLSHRALADVVERLNTIMEVTSDIREYIGVPVSYSFGLGRARAVAAAGGASYIPEKFDPTEIRTMLETGEINAISAVPSLWRVLLLRPEILQPVADRVRWIEIGSQFMAADEKRAMRELFPQARIVQHYGLTEASRSTFLDVSNAPDHQLESVGTASGSVELNINDQGAVCIRGAHVAMGVLSPEGDIMPLTDAEGWLVTKDRGELRDGHLYFLGRLDDQINISGIKVSSEQLERGIAARVPGQERHFAVAAVEDPMRGNAALLAVEDAASAALPELMAAAEDALAQYGVTGGDNLRSLTVAQLPRTGSDKVQRNKLRDLYTAHADETAPPPETLLGRIRARLMPQKRPETVQEIFQSHFPRATITRDSSFEELGGDSLSHVAVALDLERALGNLPNDWQVRSIAEIESIGPSAPRVFGQIDTPTFIRALSIVLIVVGHFDAFEYGGTGALALFFIAGLNFGAMTLPTILNTGSVVPIFVLLIRIALISWFFMAANHIVTGYGGPLAYLMVTNFVGPGYGGGAWFVAVYIQTLLVIALLLTWERPRAWLRVHGFNALAAFAVFSVALLFVCEQLFDTNHLFRRLPNLLLWLFACGALAHFSTTWQQKAVTLAIFLTGWAVFSTGLSLKYVLFAVPFALFVSAVPVPKLMIAPIRLIAGASLVIYLSHFPFRSLLEKVTGIEQAHIASLVAILGGVVFWSLYRPLDNRIRLLVTKLLSRD